jgi:hypothetical protein
VRGLAENGSSIQSLMNQFCHERLLEVMQPLHLPAVLLRLQLRFLILSSFRSCLLGTFPKVFRIWKRRWKSQYLRTNLPAHSQL